MAERLGKLMLGGWISPSAALLHRELERSIARTDPRGSSLAIMFPDDQSHARAMRCLSSFVPEYRGAGARGAQ